MISGILGILGSPALAQKLNHSEEQRKELQNEFDTLNKDYFNGELPPTKIVVKDKVIMGTIPEMGYTICGINEVTDKEYCTILISIDGNANLRVAVFTVAHETCHVANRQIDGHGAEWQGCMLKFAEGGAFQDLW